MRRWSVISWLAVGVVAAVVVAGCGSSGSSSGDSGGSSGWSQSDTEKVESKLADAITEAGLTPSKAETSCIIRGYQGMGVSASQVLANADTSPEQQEELKQLTEECLGGSAVTVPGDAPEVSGEIYEEAEETLNGPACQEDVSSEACREEATQKEDEIAEKEGLTPP